MNESKARRIDFNFAKIVRSGLVMLIPVLTVGSIALILRSLPITGYQDFINSFASGLFYNIFSFIYSSTFGMLSVYMTLTLSYCTALRRSPNDTNGAIAAGISAFLISTGFLTEAFELSSFSAVGMFTAILCGIIAPSLYIVVRRRLKQRKLFFDGSEPMFNAAMATILPLAVCCIVFALFNYAIDSIFDVSNFWQLFTDGVNRLFTAIGLNFFGALLYILLSSVMWFFGIHGSDVLESVNAHIFEPAMAMNIAATAANKAPTEIFTKTFFDVFVLMGGCGSALALLIAILLFSRRRSSRSLAKMAAFPMLFNINEMMVFGLPIIYNPIMLIPFIAAPLCCFLVSAAAMSLGIVPLTSVSVEWTTPIILGGFRSTGSAAGAILQLVNLVIGVFIYMPFVRKNDRRKLEENRAGLDELVNRQKENEANNSFTLLTEESGNVGAIAKQLSIDLPVALEKGEIFMLYQPQCNSDGKCIGAEALMRWNHSSFGMIYPPLIVKLAEESGNLTELEKYIFRRVKSDAEKFDFSLNISINVTAPSLRNESFIKFLYSEFPDAKAGDSPICLEITEQSELVTDSGIGKTLSDLHAHGFHLSIDDFSMGFTSLKYLQECNFDEVKLDGSLVKGLKDGGKSRDIISSIVYLSESLRFTVLAEYVESRELQNELEKIGCHNYQGYLFSKPIAPDELILFCESNS